jgi:hypothetical protein
MLSPMLCFSVAIPLLGHHLRAKPNPPRPLRHFPKRPNSLVKSEAFAANINNPPMPPKTYDDGPFCTKGTIWSTDFFISRTIPTELNSLIYCRCSPVKALTGIGVKDCRTRFIPLPVCHNLVLIVRLIRPLEPTLTNSLLLRRHCRSASQTHELPFAVSLPVL